jgi:hypothetical protein
MDPLTACQIKNQCRVLLNSNNHDRVDLFKDVRKEIWDLVRDESVPTEEITAEMVVNNLLSKNPSAPSAPDPA